MKKPEKITAIEVQWLDGIDEAIVNARIKVHPVRLRRYLRNWVTSLIDQEIHERAYIQSPKKR